MKTLSRLLKTTFQRISRNPYHSVGALFIMFLTFFVGGFLVLLVIWSNSALEFYESKPQIDAFFKDSSTQKQIDSFEQELKSTGKIKEINYISKEEALEIYKERNADDPLLTEFVTADILPASFQISTNEIEDVSAVAEIATSEEIVEQVVFQQDVIDKLISITGTTRNIGLIVFVFLITTSLLITLIVISLNIALHREEIETMRLVGATESYVRLPFVFEGIFYGMAAAFFATVALSTWLHFSYPSLQEFLPVASVQLGVFSNNINILPVNLSTVVYLFLLLAVTGVIIGSVGSYFATRKYLNV